MQCSAWRPISSASTSVRPLSSSTRWNSSGPSASACTPVHNDVYGFIRSPVADRGSSCTNTSRSRQSASTFSIPITVISTRGSVRHIRPLPSDSTTAIVPVSATPKFAPETATGTERNFSRRCRRAASAIAVMSQPRSSPARDRALEQQLDLRPVAMDRRHEDVRGRVVAELVDQLRQVGLDRLDPLRGQRVVEADLVRGERLDLDHLARAVPGGDRARRSRCIRRRHAPSAPGRPRA